MSELTRTISVLDIHGTHPVGITFTYLHEGEARRVVTVDTETWEEMGEPYQVTLTLEPGDKLNEEREFREDLLVAVEDYDE